MSTSAQVVPDILVVDDTPANLRLLSGMLNDAGYKVRPAPNGKTALRAAQNQPPDLILLDINMPDMDGFEVCAALKGDRKLADIPVIFISALSETVDKVKAFSTGGVDYVTKPFQFEEVLARVEAHLNLRRLRLELKDKNENLESIVAAQVKEIAEGHVATIFALSKLSESRDDDTGKHLERTQCYCRLLAQELLDRNEFPEEINARFVETIYQASPLHDVGKVAIPDAVLQKPGRLDEDEFKLMQTHTLRGAETLQRVFEAHPRNYFIAMGLQIARSHHEKWNGSGYPDAIEGSAIPLAARIMAVADVYDALTSVRCYKPAFSHEKSRDIILNDSGTHFDPRLAAAFQRIETEFARVRIEMTC